MQMSTGTSAETIVLIVGGGPVGLIAALLLAQQGIGSVIVERRQSRLSAPKAHALNPRSLEICRSLGIPRAEFEAQATPAHQGGRVRFLTTLSGIEIGSLPYERQDAAVLDVTPTPLLNISQPRLEEILLARCQRERLIEIRTGHRWISATQDDCVTSVISADAGEYLFSSRYVIAADGAGSTVRQHLGIDMDGPRELDHRLMIHFGADLRPLLAERPAILYWTLDPSASGTFIAYDISSTFVFMLRYDPRSESASDYNAARCRRIVAAAIGDPAAEIEIRHILPWTMSAQVAQAYRRDRIFLAGDAAHRFPPSGGLGLNTGVQDAHNLAWKIAAVEHGQAKADLLDSYEQERRPVAVQNSGQSKDNAIKIRSLYEAIHRAAAAHPAGLTGHLATPGARETFVRLIDERQEHFDSLRLQLGFVYGESEDTGQPVDQFVPIACPGARLPHGWINVAGARASSLDLVSPTSFTLIVGKGGDHWQTSLLARDKIVRLVRDGADFTDDSGTWRALVKLGDRGAVLVRPDGHILAIAPDDTPETIGRLQHDLKAYLGTGAISRELR